MIRRFVYGPLWAGSARVVTAADRWVHFHRFTARHLCDAYDVLTGTPRHLVRAYRQGGSPPHAAAHSYQSHPSHEEAR